MNLASGIYTPEEYEELLELMSFRKIERTNDFVKYAEENGLYKRGSDIRTYIRYVEMNNNLYIQNVEVRYLGEIEGFEIEYKDVCSIKDFDEYIFGIFDSFNIPVINPGDEYWKYELVQIYNYLYPDNPVTKYEDIPDGLIIIENGKLCIDSDAAKKMYRYVTDNYDLSDSPYLTLVPEYRESGQYVITPNHLIYNSMIEEIIRQHNMLTTVCPSWNVSSDFSNDIISALYDFDEFREALKTDKYHMCVGFKSTRKTKFLNPDDTQRTELWELNNIDIIIFRKQGNLFSVTDNVSGDNRNNIIPYQVGSEPRVTDCKKITFNFIYPDDTPTYWRKAISVTYDEPISLADGMNFTLNNFLNLDGIAPSYHTTTGYRWLDSVGFEHSRRYIKPRYYDNIPIPDENENPEDVYPPLINPTYPIGHTPIEFEFPIPVPTPPTIVVVAPTAPTPPPPIPMPPSVPPEIPVVEEDDSLYSVFTKIYTPDIAELRELGNVLWSDTLISKLKSLWQNNPLDGIISLGLIYHDPDTKNSQRENIMLGNVDSGVSSLLVNEPFTYVECGDMYISRFWQDARDFEPYTSISIFLPFIGIRKLNTSDVMGRSINVKYRCDCITGKVVAIITVNFNGKNLPLYQFEGNDRVELPLTGRDYSSSITNGVLSGLTVLGSAITTMIQPEIGIPMAIGSGIAAQGGLVTGKDTRASIEKVGNISSVSGAMLYKKPYIMIDRSIAYSPTNYQSYYGTPTQSTIKLKYITGFVRVKAVHLESINCTEDEKTMIEALLKSGVIV